MSGRDFLAWLGNEGELFQVKQKIAGLESQVFNYGVEVQKLKDAQKTSQDRKQINQLKREESELKAKRKYLIGSIRKNVDSLWKTTLEATGRAWPAWNELAATVYQELGTLSEKPVSPVEYRKLWIQHIRDTLGSSQHFPYLRQEVQKWQVECLLTASEIPVCDKEMLARLPPGSFCLQFRFKLDEAFLSRDDQASYIIDNPVRKDTVFHLPTVSTAGWKGNLRWTANKLWADRTAPAEDLAEERFRLALLFGDETGEEEGARLARYLDDCHLEAKGLYRQKLRRHFSIEDDRTRLPHHAGRLEFYPTFFDRIDIEVINPHRRDTRAGTQPIYLESVPANTSGWFTLVYVPFDLVGRPLEVKPALEADLPLLTNAIEAMFCTYGFSAKKSSGFGQAAPKVERMTLGLNTLAWSKDCCIFEKDSFELTYLTDAVKKLLADVGDAV